MKNWLKTLFLSLLLAASFACKGQSVITQYIYEVQIYTNIIHEISNRVWTVSNITIRTQNEITQNVNRVYNYSTTNLYFNIITNNYVDTVVGTNIEVNISTNYDYNTNIYTNYWITNHVSEIKNTYITTIHTNLHQDIFVTYETNYVSEVTLTNFEGYVQQCENIISNGIDTISDMTNTLGDAMLYAYMVNELAVRLASTNAVLYYATNSFVYVDAFDNEHANVYSLACNNMNGAILSKSISAAASQSYKVTFLNDNLSGVGFYFDISHAAESEYGMDAAYLPRSIEPISYSGYYYIPLKLCWRGSYKAAKSGIGGGWDWITTGVLSVYLAKMEYADGVYRFLEIEEYTVSNSWWPERINVNSYLTAYRLSGTGPSYVRISNPTGTYTDGVNVLCFPTFPSFYGWDTLYKLYKITGLRLR